MIDPLRLGDRRRNFRRDSRAVLRKGQCLGGSLSSYVDRGPSRYLETKTHRQW